MQLSAITRYPVKSCRGQARTAETVEPWGLAGDRRWMLADDSGEVVTAREHPRLVLISVDLDPDGGLVLTAPGHDDLLVPVPSTSVVPVRIFGGNPLDATPAGPQADGWFSAVLATSVRLVHLDDPTRRSVSPDFGRPDDRVSFADAYPMLLATVASLDALNDLIVAGPRADEGPLPMQRFRPNLVVAGSEPWAEDGWRRLRIGDAEFRAVKGCARCVMTLVDPVTAAKGKEPIATLARHRRWDGQTWFGMNLIPDNPGVTVRVGDPVEILDAVATPDGPPR